MCYIVDQFLNGRNLVSELTLAQKHTGGVGVQCCQLLIITLLYAGGVGVQCCQLLIITLLHAGGVGVQCCQLLRANRRLVRSNECTRRAVRGTGFRYPGFSLQSVQ